MPPTEFVLIIVYAGLGKGKSAYAIIGLVEILVNIYKLSEEEAWEKVKEFICFHPTQFFDKLDQIRDSGFYRVPGIVWDDAGLWLYALEWNDPFIKQVGKYMNVARSRLASMILTTPNPNWIIKKLRGFPDARTVKIVKKTGAPRTEYLRRARAYSNDMLPDLHKYRVNIRWDDHFNCRMPDDFYAWYAPLRDMYEEMALDLIKKAWEEKRKDSLVPELVDYPGLQIPELTPLRV